MSSDDDLTEMPWGGILKLTALTAVGAFATYASLCWSAIRREQREKEERERNVWTDKNRWGD